MGIGHDKDTRYGIPPCRIDERGKRMPTREKEKRDAFRRMDKPTRGGRMDKEASEDLKERGDEHSDAIKEKGVEARETIDSQSYERRKGHKGLNSPQ